LPDLKIKILPGRSLNGACLFFHWKRLLSDEDLPGAKKFLMGPKKFIAIALLHANKNKS
jgi:hypothetical protein